MLKFYKDFLIDSSKLSQVVDIILIFTERMRNREDM